MHRVRSSLVFLAIAAAPFAATNFSHAGALDQVIANVNDPRAPNGTITEFNATNMTVRQLRARVGRVQRQQAIAVWCIGARMGGVGGTGESAFDVFVGNEPDTIVASLRKIGVTHDTKLTDVCWMNQKEFERRRR
jgi:hypothetical protein